MQDDLSQFLPYLLNQAAEASSREFQAYYKAKFGMLRTEWRVLFHLGLYGELSATRICQMAALHKTKVSRAVTALEKKRLIGRRTDEADRRVELLGLTEAGQAAFADLRGAAARFEAELVADWPAPEVAVLRESLQRLAARGDLS